MIIMYLHYNVSFTYITKYIFIKYCETFKLNILYYFHNISSSLFSFHQYICTQRISIKLSKGQNRSSRVSEGNRFKSYDNATTGIFSSQLLVVYHLESGMPKLHSYTRPKADPEIFAWGRRRGYRARTSLPPLQENSKLLYLKSESKLTKNRPQKFLDPRIEYNNFFRGKTALSLLVGLLINIYLLKYFNFLLCKREILLCRLITNPLRFHFIYFFKPQEKQTF